MEEIMLLRLSACCGQWSFSLGHCNSIKPGVVCSVLQKVTCKILLSLFLFLFGGVSLSAVIGSLFPPPDRTKLVFEIESSWNFVMSYWGK